MPVIDFKVRNWEQFNAYMLALPRSIVRVALPAIVRYIIGNDAHGLAHPDKYQYITRASAYGQTFQSDKQRRWFFANHMQDKIGNHRTGESENAYQYVEKDDFHFAITNPTKGAYFTRSDDGQAMQPAMVGWRKASLVILDNMIGAIRAANQEIDRWIRDNKF
jgi:hypothetical protein